jgi:acyl-CoA thioester hydrolase
MPRKDLTIKPRYQETDQMGIVHHSSYFAWFELARDNYVENLGLSYKKIEDMGLLMKVKQCQCDYILASYYDKNVVIKVKKQHYNGVKIILGYEVYNQLDEELLTRASVEYVFVNRNNKIINLKKYYCDLSYILEGAE